MPTTIHDQPSDFSIDEVEECGQTCRRVTGTATNEQTSPASNVTVELRMYPGNGTDGDLLWRTTEPVGALAVGESLSVTRGVDLSSSDVYSITLSEGWIAVETIIRSDTDTMTTVDRLNVVWFLRVAIKHALLQSLRENAEERALTARLDRADTLDFSVLAS